jgi:hypothetical protein
MRPRTYVIVALGVAAALVGAILAVNVRVDPYGLAGASRERGGVVEATRPGAFWRNALTVRDAMPRTVMLGTSRAEFGLDPRYPGFAPQYRPVSNLAIGGLSVDQIRLLLVHANATSALRMAVIGLDMESFMDDGRTDFDPAALLGNAESEPEPLVRLRIGVARETLSASVARLSVEKMTSAAGGNRAVSTDKRNWRIPDEALTLWDGQRGIIWVAEYDNFYARSPLLFPQGPSASRWSADRKRAAAMASFGELLRYARDHDIELRMFISPVHARYLEWYRRVGWWPLFEDWKRALVDAIDAQSKADAARPLFALWDFAGFHPIATERVPQIGDHRARMRWYRDTSHYSPEVGDMILDLILGAPGVQSSPLPNRRLDRSAIDADLFEIRSEGVRYRSAEPREVADVDEMLAYLRRAAKR